MPNDRPLAQSESLYTIGKEKRETRFDDQHRGAHQIVAVLGDTRSRRN
jgi:hypothetical protein